jgi:hypothetical protein
VNPRYLAIRQHCPLCAAPLKWSCASGIGAEGTAHCQDGVTVSRRWPGTDAVPCYWGGTRVVRAADHLVYLVLPVSTEEVER